jgi:integrase
MKKVFWQEKFRTLYEEVNLLSCSAPHLKPIIITALNTGMRKGEILSLTWDDIDFENNFITVKHTVSKSKKTIRIPISSTLRKGFQPLRITLTVLKTQTHLKEPLVWHVKGLISKGLGFTI